MTTQNIKVEVSLSRNNQGTVSLRIVDEKSHLEFCEINFSLKEFAQVITGLTISDVVAEVKHLTKVGKIKVKEPRQIRLHKSLNDKEKIKQILTKDWKETGWEVDIGIGYL